MCVFTQHRSLEQVAAVPEQPHVVFYLQDVFNGEYVDVVQLLLNAAIKILGALLH